MGKRDGKLGGKARLIACCLHSTAISSRIRQVPIVFDDSVRSVRRQIRAGNFAVGQVSPSNSAFALLTYVAITALD